MKILDLFAGVGGFSLGFEMASDVFETVAFCEFDEKAQKVLKKHWPDVPVFKDVREIDGEKYRDTISVITGGVPCQPWSVAGKKRKDKDDRHLWPEMFRVIREAKPRWVIVENVQGFVNQEMGFSATKLDLESEGYETRSFLLPACGVEAPHQRYRIFIVAYTGCELRERAIQRGEDEKEIGQGDADQYKRSSSAPNLDVAHSKPEGRQGRLHRRENTGRESQQGHSGCGGTTQIQPEQNWWAVEPNVGRVAHGVSGRVDRLKQLGNAVVPQLIQRIAESILEAEGYNIEQH